MPSHPLSAPSQSGIRGIRAYLGLLGLPPWPACLASLDPWRGGVKHQAGGGGDGADGAGI